MTQPILFKNKFKTVQFGKVLVLAVQKVFFQKIKIYVLTNLANFSARRRNKIK